MKKLFIATFIFVLSFNIAQSNEKTLFLNMEYVVKNSIIGKTTLKKINELNSKNINDLKLKEKKLVELEKEIKKKQNVISEDELKNEINQLKEKVKKFRTEKDLMVTEYKEYKEKELSNLYKIINPIIQAYMDNNNIDILLDTKNIIFGKKSSDIRAAIIAEIDKKFN